MPENVPVAVPTPLSEYNIPTEVTEKTAMVKTTNFKSVLSNTVGFLKTKQIKKHEQFFLQTIYHINCINLKIYN